MVVAHEQGALVPLAQERPQHADGVGLVLGQLVRVVAPAADEPDEGAGVVPGLLGVFVLVEDQRHGEGDAEAGRLRDEPGVHQCFDGRPGLLDEGAHVDDALVVVDELLVVRKDADVQRAGHGSPWCSCRQWYDGDDKIIKTFFYIFVNIFLKEDRLKLGSY